MSRTLLLRLEDACNRFSDTVGNIAAVLLLALLANIFFDVVMRYVFNDVSIAMQELEWHLYSAVFLLGVAYTLRRDAHVRVDLIYERLGPRWRGVIDIAGTLLLLIPFCVVVAGYGFEFARAALEINEGSGDPGGLPWRWLVKGLIPLSFACALVSGIGFLLRAVNEALGLRKAHHHGEGKL
ncbi:MAG: TRAP transporter small permease subunit [Gammaproteobacteria bacterium]|nr:TRAP transporter small permease subunit [Gammaproteobacteria bacterium]